MKEIHEGVFGRPTGSAVFIEFAEKVYLPWSKENKRSTSDQYYIDVFRAFFKRKTFAEISSMLIEKFKSERRKTPTKLGKPRKPASVNRELECLSSIFSMAMRKPHRLIRENPCREVAKLKKENSRNRYLTAEEEERLLAACAGDRTYIKSILILALNTGMRRGEILSLRWGQVDLQRNFIYLVRTKSGKKRDVPINTAVKEELLALDTRGSNEYVFASPKAGRAVADCKHAFTSACRRAGIGDLHFHASGTRRRQGWPKQERSRQRSKTYSAIRTYE